MTQCGAQTQLTTLHGLLTMQDPAGFRPQVSGINSRGVLRVPCSEGSCCVVDTEAAHIILPEVHAVVIRYPSYGTCSSFCRAWEAPARAQLRP